MNIEDKILDKVKKCLALSKSANEHEAATALRQAQKLMEIHNLTAADVLSSQVIEVRKKSGVGMKPPQWQEYLSVTIAKAFGCKIIFNSHRLLGGHWVFIGVGSAPEVAAYSFEVLFRQVKKARSEYIRTRLSRCTVKNKTSRADTFCAGWVMSATELLEPYEPEPSACNAIAALFEKKYPHLPCLKAIRRKGKDPADFLNGQLAGADAQLHRGVGAADRPLSLGER